MSEDKCKCSSHKEKEECRHYLEETDECCLQIVYAEGTLTLEEIGEKLDLSAERVRQIEKKALEKLEKLNKKSLKYELDEYI